MMTWSADFNHAPMLELKLIDGTRLTYLPDELQHAGPKPDHKDATHVWLWFVPIPKGGLIIDGFRVDWGTDKHWRTTQRYTVSQYEELTIRWEFKIV